MASKFKETVVLTVELTVDLGRELSDNSVKKLAKAVKQVITDGRDGLHAELAPVTKVMVR